MKKIFDIPLNRKNTWSTKWDLYKDKDIIPLWVADMDFKSPDVVEKAFKERIEHGGYGYTEIPQELNREIVHSYKKNNWFIQEDWIVWLPGLETVIHQIYNLIMDTQSVIVPRPIYPPFLNAAKHSNKKIIFHDLETVDGRLVYNFDKLSQEAEDNSWLMFINPHNPGGTIFSTDELEDLAKLILKKNMYVLADEIHSDFILSSSDKHLHLAMLEGMADRVITINSLSKTFNIAGLNCAFSIIPNQLMRKKFKNILKGHTPSPSIFGLIATLACLKDGSEWKEDLIKYLNINKDFLLNQFSSRKDIEIIEPKGTYLLWFKVLNAKSEKLQEHFEKFGVGLSDGKDFGKPGWMRLNFGTNYELLKQAMPRIHKALDDLL
tara:strand:- start:1123 stop:2256 length:1134 start_codon:yes stop_codon:yes gene_type:complete